MKAIRECLIAVLVLTGVSVGRGGVEEPAKTVDSLESHFDHLKVGELSFTNVWVARQTNYNILIRHNGGIHTIKLTDLPANELTELKGQIGRLASLDDPAHPTRGNALLERLMSELKTMPPRTLAILGGSVLLLIGLIVLVSRRNGAPTSA